jgi:anti-sigma factor RsiW
MSRELLPWYVNGTLSPEEAKAVERELTQSESARAELRLWQAVARDRDENRATSVEGGAELGWLRLARQLDMAPPGRRPTRWPMAAAAALVAVIGAQSVLLYRSDRAHREEIRQLGEAPGGVRENEWRIQMRFREGVTLAQVESVLAAAEARVVDGPSAIGIYELAVPRARFANAQAAARWLSEQPAVAQAMAPP